MDEQTNIVVSAGKGVDVVVAEYVAAREEIRQLSRGPAGCRLPQL